MEGSESPLLDGADAEHTRAQKAGGTFIAGLHSLLKVLTLYEPNNTAVIRLVESLHETLTNHFATGVDELKIQLLQDECFINGKLLKVDAALWERATDLARLLGRFDLGEVTVSSGVTREVLDTMVADLAESLRTGETTLPAGGYETVRLGKSSGRSIASFRFEPDRLAIWLYAGLLDVVERLYREYREGRTPSLLPVRRLLQLLIDSARSLGGIFQVLATMRDPKRQMTLPRVRVAMAVDSVGFGIFIGLRNTELMTLALSALMGSLSESTDPETAVEPLFAYPGLGAAAMVLILAVHDTRLALQGAPAGVPGRLLAAVEVFNRLITHPTESVSPTTAIRSMSNGEAAGCDKAMGKLFAAYKGILPLGAPVTLTDGRTGVVLSQGTTKESKRLPTIGIIQDGVLTEQIDLLARQDVKVAAAPTFLEADMDLTQLRLPEA
jgi:hypothetical protein